MKQKKPKDAIKINEQDFFNQILDLAHIHHWLVAHFRPARTAHGWGTAVAGDGAGFPDLVLVETRPPFRLVFVELKVGGRIPTGAQRLWLDALATCAQGIGDRMIVRLWRPEDWDEIVRLLTRGKGE